MLFYSSSKYFSGALCDQLALRWPHYYDALRNGLNILFYGTKKNEFQDLNFQKCSFFSVVLYVKLQIFAHFHTNTFVVLQTELQLEGIKLFAACV